jgi:hypothetical protein
MNSQSRSANQSLATPLLNPRHEAFAQAVASGQSSAEAYVCIYGQTRRHAAAVGGSRLRKKPAVTARVKALQTAAAEGVTVHLHHLLSFLSRVINTPISEVTESSTLCHRRKDTAYDEDLAMPDKLTAVALAARLQGFFRHSPNARPSPPPIIPHPNVLTEEERLIIIAQKRAASIADNGLPDDDHEFEPIP